MRNFTRHILEYLTSDFRAHDQICGLGFTSKFVQDFNESSELLQHLSTFANVPIAAHPMTTHYSQKSRFLPLIIMHVYYMK